MNTTTQKQNAAHLRAKIKQARTRPELERLETACQRLYEAGLITARDYSQTDDMIFQRLAKLDA